MQKALWRRDTAAGRAHQVALLNQIRLNYVLDCAFFFADRRGHSVQADRPAAELLDNCSHQAPIHSIETFFIHIEHIKGGVSDLRSNNAIALYLGVVTDSAQQPITDARRAARATRDFCRTVVFNRQIELIGRARDDLRQL